jgi:hypothetical protein
VKSQWLHWEGARLEGEWQGIEYVALSENSSQSTAVLTVKLHHPPVGMGSASFDLQGVNRGQSLRWLVERLEPTDDEVLLTLEDVGQEPQNWRILLRDGGTRALHPFFSAAEFTTALERQKRDCRPAVQKEALRVRKKRPPVDLLTKDYTGFVNLMADRVRVLNPHWADLSAASLERVFLELLAHHADMLSYYQDRVASEAFLDEAVQRNSLRQHGLLLGYRLFDGTSAETTLAFETRSDGYLPAGLSVRMAAAPDEARVVFYLPERARVVAAHSRLKLAAWPGAVDAQVPAGATSVLLWGNVEGLTRGQRLAFLQDATAQLVEITEVQKLRLPGWVERPQPQDAARVPDDILALTREPPRVEPTVVAPPPELTAVWFQPPLTTAVHPFEEGFTLRGNLATAWHGEARAAHYRPHPGPELPLHHVLIPNDRQHTVHQRTRDGQQLLRALRIPEGPVSHIQRGEEPAALVLEVWVQGVRWSRVEHFHGSLPFHRHFVATADEDGTVWLQFGDGIQGEAVDATRDQVEIRYRMGEPISGNCAPGTLTQVVPPEDGAQRAQLEQVELTWFTNITPGRGGRQPETRDMARMAIPASLRHGPVERAVTLEDYAAVASSVPGVARATARHLGGLYNTVLVLVDPEGQMELSPELRQALQARLERARMAGREVIISTPSYVPISLVLEVTPEPGAFPHRVRDTVYAALRPGTRSHPGFFHPDRLSFGDDIELGDILTHVQSLPGVRSVRALSLRRQGPGAYEVLERIVLSPYEVARLDEEQGVGHLEVQMSESGAFRVEVRP